MPADADYVFDRIGSDPDRRAQALARDAEQVVVMRRALERQHEIWFRAGKSWRPSDVALAAAMDQAMAERSAAVARTLHGIVVKFVHARWAGDADDHVRLAPYAVLFLQWETAFPEQWRSARESASWGLKKHVLRRFVQAGVPAQFQSDVVELVMQAVGREHRCEDQGYPAVARVVDGPELRSRLDAASRSEDPLVRLRAEWVRWVIDHPAAPVTAAGWRRWLAQDEHG